MSSEGQSLMKGSAKYNYKMNSSDVICLIAVVPLVFLGALVLSTIGLRQKENVSCKEIHQCTRS